MSFPAPTGPYAVGRRSFDWTDASRIERFDRGRKREIVTWIWYPASPTGNARPGRYLPGRWSAAARWEALDLHLHTHGLLYALTHTPTMSSTTFVRMETHSVDDAPLLPGAQRFPVLLFEPGLGQMPTDYTALLEDLASHGYIVVGINPTYFAFVTAFADGRQVGRMPLRDLITADLNVLFPIWVQDMTFALDQTMKLAINPHDPFYGRLDLTRIGAFGHSYGGAAAVSSCNEDVRIKAGIDIDGSLRGWSPAWQLSKPLLLLDSDHGIYPDYTKERLYQEAKSCYRANVRGAMHRSFMDQALFPFTGQERERLVGTVPALRMMQLTRRCICTFFDIHLKGQSPASIRKLCKEYPEIQFQQHEP